MTSPSRAPAPAAPPPSSARPSIVPPASTCCSGAREEQPRSASSPDEPRDATTASACRSSRAAASYCTHARPAASEAALLAAGSWLDSADGPVRMDAGAPPGSGDGVFAINTGLRQGEQFRLRWSDVDLGE